MTRTLGATLLVALVALAVFAWGTDDFSAFTAEAARRERVLHDPRTLPAVTLQDQDGRRFGLDVYRGKKVAVEFIYTHCESVCRSLGTAFGQIQETVAPERFEHDFALLSISFDPQRDDRTALNAWARMHGADGRHWRVARIDDPVELARLMAAFGVVAIPDGLGGYEHNAAIHLLDRNGRLARIDDIASPGRFLAVADLQAP